MSCNVKARVGDAKRPVQLGIEIGETLLVKYAKRPLGGVHYLNTMNK